MSSIRLFVLDSLAKRGPMHGHALRLLAEEEHIHVWTDFTVGAVYGVIKRLSGEGLIEEDRVEREGNYPERVVYRITDAGARSLDQLRREGLEAFSLRPDPVDLALAKLDPDRLDELEGVIRGRLATLESELEAGLVHLERIRHYLSVAEYYAMRHRSSRLRGEIEWHTELLAALPEIISDETSRKRPE